MSTAAILDPPGDSSLEIALLLGRMGDTIQQIFISPKLDYSQTNQLVGLIEAFTEFFSENPGCTKFVEHTITLNTTKLIQVKPYPIPFANVSGVFKEVDKMFKL